MSDSVLIPTIGYVFRCAVEKNYIDFMEYIYFDSSETDCLRYVQDGEPNTWQKIMRKNRGCNPNTIITLLSMIPYRNINHMISLVDHYDQTDRKLCRWIQGLMGNDKFFPYRNLRKCLLNRKIPLRSYYMQEFFHQIFGQTGVSFILFNYLEISKSMVRRLRLLCRTLSETERNQLLLIWNYE